MSRKKKKKENKVEIINSISKKVKPSKKKKSKKEDKLPKEEAVDLKALVSRIEALEKEVATLKKNEKTTTSPVKTAPATRKKATPPTDKIPEGIKNATFSSTLTVPNAVKIIRTLKTELELSNFIKGDERIGIKRAVAIRKKSL